MNLNSWILVFIGGGLGSIFRVGMSFWISSAKYLYLSTLLVNIIASFLLGFFIQKQISHPDSDWIKLLLVSGFCGGLSTFSTFSNDNFVLIQSGRWLEAVLYSISSIISGLSAIWIAFKYF